MLFPYFDMSASNLMLHVRASSLILESLITQFDDLILTQITLHRKRQNVGILCRSPAERKGANWRCDGMHNYIVEARIQLASTARNMPKKGNGHEMVNQSHLQTRELHMAMSHLITIQSMNNKVKYI